MGAVVEIMPIEMSADTKRNAHCHYCNVTGQRHSYALCLHKLTLRKVSRLKEDWSECSAAIGKKTCPAIDMKENEVEKGYALYFIERLKFIGIAGLVDIAKEMFKPTAKKAAPVKRVVAKPVVDELDLDIDEGDYQDALNSAVATPKVAVPHKEGESLIDIARRMMASKA